MRRRLSESREVGGADPIDAHLGTAAAPGVLTRAAHLFRSRAALGLSPIIAPAMLFVPLGVLLGPQVLNILSVGVLDHLNTVVSVALAALGVFVGAALGSQPRSERHILLAASAEAAVTLGVVSLALYVLLASWGVPLDGAPPVMVALVLGVCASASSAGASETSPDPVHRLATRVADLDDVLPIILGGFALASIGQPTVVGTLVFGGLTCLLGAGIAVAGWLLFERATGAAERGVFVLGTLVLLGGSAAFLAVSPLLAGMVAGLLWTVLPGRADAIIRSDLQKVQHPLVVLLLLTAGASLVPGRVALWLFAPFVLFRLAGKLGGGWVASQLARGVAPADLGAYLIPPGVLGIAFALNFHQVFPTATAAAVISATAAGSLISELLALLAPPASAADEAGERQ